MLTDRVRFTPFLGECESKEWISQKLNNGEFDYWLVLQVISLDRENEKFKAAQISVVAPSQLREERLNSLQNRMGVEPSKWEDTPDKYKVGDTFEYGCHAPVWHASGKAEMEMMVEGVKIAQTIPHFFGVYMDRQVNGMGARGWDLIKGDLWPMKKAA